LHLLKDSKLGLSIGSESICHSPKVKSQEQQQT